MTRTTFIIILSIWNCHVGARDIPLTWERLMQQTDLVGTGQVIKAELINDNMSSKFPTESFDLVFEINVQKQLYNQPEFEPKESNSDMRIYATHNAMNLPVCHEATFFILVSDGIYRLSDSQFAVWPINRIRTQADEKSPTMLTDVFNKDQISVNELPESLKEEVIRKKESIQNGTYSVQLVLEKHLTVSALETVLSDYSKIVE